MDRENLRELRRMARADARARIRLLRAHDPAASDQDGDDVPDPYYGGPSGFDLVYEMVHRSCTALLAELRDEERSRA
jgi:protein-tyrosine phosphatase